MFYGWRVLGGLCGIYFLSVGVVFYSFAVVLPSMILDLGWTRGGASVGHAILALTFGVGAILAAMVLERIGSRNTIALGGALSALGSIVIYFTDSLNQFYVGIAIVGMGISLQSMVPGTQLLTDWFTRRRAFAMGGLGAFIAAPAVAYLIETMEDWRVAWLVTAACAALGSVIAILFVRNHPSELGTFPDGVDPATEIELETTETSKPKSSVYQTRAEWSTGEAYRTWALWTIVLAAGLAGIGLALNASQSVIHLLDQGLSPVVAGSAVGIVGLFSTGGRLFAGATGDRFDPRFLLAGGLGIELPGIIMLNFTDTAALVYAYSILFGVGNGATVVALPALVANYFGAAGYAKTIGIVHLVLTPFAAAASVLAGYMYDYSQSYTNVFLGYAAISILPVILILMMKPPRHKSEAAMVAAAAA